MCHTTPAKYLSQLLTCPGCNAMGAVAWQDDNKGGQAMVLRGGFHSEPKRSVSGDPIVVCTECDQIQTLSAIQPEVKL